MLPEQKDAALLWDIKQAAEDITDFVKGKHVQKFSHYKKRPQKG
jgi:uncharacterized protein with HEPN domain